MSDPFPDLPPPDLAQLDLRFTADFDGIELRAMLSNPDTWQWFPFSEGKELEDAIAFWMSLSRYRLGLTAVWDGKIVGMGVLLPAPYKKMAHQTSFYIVVAEPWRRKGIGTTILRNLMHLARERFRLEFIHADVYQGSPILSLLERGGFFCCFTQADYVQVGSRLVARHLMQKRLTPGQVELQIRRDG